MEEMGTLLMAEVWEQNKGLVSYVARRYLSINNAVCIDDLMQAGYIGLHNAVHNYDRNRGSFSTCAVFYLKKSMREAIGIRTKKMDPLDNAASLDAPISENEDFTMLDVLAAPEPGDWLETEELCKIVRSAVAVLPDSYREAIEAVYWKGMSARAAAEYLGVSKQNVYDRLDMGYSLLRLDKRVMALAIAYGIFDAIDAAPYKRTAETAAIQNIAAENNRTNIRHLFEVRECKALYDFLGSLATLKGG